MTDPNALLPDRTRQVHRSLLNAMLTTGAVSSMVDLADSLGMSSVELATHLDLLTQADYLGRNEAGRLTCLYPFSVVPTAHVVVLGAARRFAMCSIDALGMAAMLDQMVTIEGHCAECGVDIRIDVKSGHIARANPAEAVVVARRGGAEPACEVCCPGTLFACGLAHGQAVAERSSATEVVPLSEALHHAESIFGGFRGETLPARRPRSEAPMGRLRT